MIFFSTLLLSMFITIVLIPVFRGLALRLNILDIPDARKVHMAPTPRSGGLAMALGALVPVVLWSPSDEFVRAAILGSTILVFFGLVDDWKNLDYKIKFAGQIVAALLAVLYGGVKIVKLGALLPEGLLIPDILTVPLTVIVIVGVTNAINLADGLDGLAGGISLLSFVCIGYLAYRSDQTVIAVMAFAVSGGIFGFLRFNTFPATVFMGDAGSQFLGFSAIVLSLKLTQGHTPLSPLLPLILLGFPVLDTLTVMLQRMSEGHSPFHPDNKHFHHKLIRIGLLHSEAVVAIYTIQTLLTFAAFYFRFYSEWSLLAFFILFSSIIVCGFHITEKTGWKLKRYDFLNEIFEKRLKLLRDRILGIRITFRILRFGVPGLFFITCLIPASTPRYFSLLDLALLLLLLIVWFGAQSKLRSVLRISLYLVIPFVVFQSEVETSTWISAGMMHVYNLLFLLLVFVVMVTLRLSRRAGFKSTPMDFLILFIAVVAPLLPEESIRDLHMGVVAVKIIILFFSYEVLIGELRGELKKLGLATMAAMVVIVLKGFI